MNSAGKTFAALIRPVFQDGVMLEKRHLRSPAAASLLTLAAVIRTGLTLSLIAPFLIASKVMAQPKAFQSKEFTSAAHGYPWSFPRDHGGHDSFQTEWWYYTGQLYGEGTQPFRDKPWYGFQLTFFRRALGSGKSVDSRHSQQGFLGHGVIADIARQRCDFASKRAPATLGIGGAAPNWLSLWLAGWSAEQIGGDHILRYDVSIPVSADTGKSSPPSSREWSVRLSGASDKAPALQGVGGLSKKGSCDGCASQYYSVPDLTMKGEVRVSSEDGSTPVSPHVTGLGWMDHEFMSNALAPEQVGWDWMGLMLKNGDRVMVFRVRSADGKGNFISGGAVVNGVARSLGGDDITLTPLDGWYSDRSKVSYPIAWRVEIPSIQLITTVIARIPGCEIGGNDAESSGASIDAPNATTYWEGPVASADESVIGYLEMTGYSGKIAL